MPGLGGLAHQSRILAEGWRFPVIFITAYPKDTAKAHAMSAGAIAFLSKPFEEGQLIHVLQVALQERADPAI